MLARLLSMSVRGWTAQNGSTPLDFAKKKGHSTVVALVLRKVRAAGRRGAARVWSGASIICHALHMRRAHRMCAGSIFLAVPAVLLAYAVPAVCLSVQPPCPIQRPRRPALIPAHVFAGLPARGFVDGAYRGEHPALKRQQPVTTCAAETTQSAVEKSPLARIEASL